MRCNVWEFALDGGEILTESSGVTLSVAGSSIIAGLGEEYIRIKNFC